MSESNKDNFGEELNIIYENLDEKTKKEIDELPKIEFKISLLKTISEPEIKQIYENLKPENRQKIDQMNIRDRYTFLKQFKKKTSLSDKIAKPDKQGNQNIQNIKNLLTKILLKNSSVISEISMDIYFAPKFNKTIIIPAKNLLPFKVLNNKKIDSILNNKKKILLV